MRPFIRYGFVGGVIITGYFVAVLLLTIFNPWLVTGTALGWLAFPAYLLMDAVDALGWVILGRVGVYVLEGLIAFAIGFLGGVSVQNVLLLIRGMDGKGKRG